MQKLCEITSFTKIVFQNHDFLQFLTLQQNKI